MCFHFVGIVSGISNHVLVYIHVGGELVSFPDQMYACIRSGNETSGL